MSVAVFAAVIICDMLFLSITSTSIAAAICSDADIIISNLLESIYTADNAELSKLI